MSITKRVWKKSDLTKAISRKTDYFRARIEKSINNKAKIEPFKLHNVNPENVNYNLNTSLPKNYGLRLSPILSGGWDRQIEKISNYDFIYSIDKHFNDGKEWGETDFYQRGKEAVEDNRSWEGRGTYNEIEEFEQYLERIDDLYTKINSEGYKTQRELFNLESRSSQFPPKYWRALETNEITVNVGRDGEFIMSDGWHRLSISKALGLDKIPVRIKVRHSKWQEKRRKVAEGQIEPEEHPDLISVKNKS